MSPSSPGAELLFILAPPRSFTSLIGAMIGQHPQIYGLPETHLLIDETMDDWWRRCEWVSYPMADGLLRAVAQLRFGEQTEEAVRMANGWLRRRSHFTTGMILELLAAQAHPRILVDKSPSTVYRLDSLQRVQSFFPRARFIHLLRHPRGQGESVLKYIDACAQYGPVPLWLTVLASFPSPFPSRWDPEPVDPQRSWYTLNMNICEFLKMVPPERKLQVRGEDVLVDPERALPQIAEWLSLRTDAEAIQSMMHPECSPYACFGPPGARLGNDVFFLDQPTFRPSEAKLPETEGPLSWRQDGQGLWPEVKDLAHQFGYA